MLIRNGFRVRTFFSTKSVDGKARVSRHLLPGKKLVLVFLSALLLIMAGLFESCNLFQASQEWMLVNQADDSVTVTVPAGTYTSTYDSNSGGGVMIGGRSDEPIFLI